MLVLNDKQIAEQMADEKLMNIFNKINNKEELTEYDIKYLVRSDCDHASFERGGARRWNEWCSIVINIQNRYFEFGYDEGLTECQENDYSDTSINEVIPEEVTKTIVEIVWKQK